MNANQIKKATKDELLAARIKYAKPGDDGTITRHARDTIARIDKALEPQLSDGDFAKLPEPPPPAKRNRATTPKADAKPAPAKPAPAKAQPAKDDKGAAKGAAAAPAKDATKTRTDKGSKGDAKQGKAQRAAAGDKPKLTYANLATWAKDASGLEQGFLLAAHKAIVAEVKAGELNDRRAKALDEAKRVLAKQIRDNRKAGVKAQPAKAKDDKPKGRKARRDPPPPKGAATVATNAHADLLAKRKELKAKFDAATTDAVRNAIKEEQRENEAAIRESRKARAGGGGSTTGTTRTRRARADAGTQATKSRKRKPVPGVAGTVASEPAIIELIRKRTQWPKQVRECIEQVVVGLDKAYAG